MHRLRALDRWWRVGAVAVAVLLAAPVLVAVLRAQDAGWRPSGASGLVALQAIDAASGNPPLEGAPTAADLPSDPHLRHPGPLQAYLAAAPVRILGPASGLVVATALVNVGALLLGAWVVFRRVGPLAGVGAAVLLAALTWALGPVALTDPVGATPGVLPLAALALLAWAVGSGDRTLLPVFALASAVVVQQHLALVGIGAVLTVGGLAGLGQWAWRTRRHRSPRPEAPPSDPVVDAWSLGRAWRSDHAHAHVDAELGEGERWWPWAAAALLVWGLCWAPVVYGQLTGQTSALTDLLQAGWAYDGRTVGLGRGLRLALRSLAAPPLVGVTGTTGADLAEPLSVVDWVGSFAVVGFLVALVSRTWRSRPALGRLALSALAVAGAGAVSVAQQPAVVEQRLAAQRWALVASVLAWTAIGWAAARWVARGAPAPRDRRLPLAPAGLVALVVVALAASTLAEPTAYRDGSLFALEDRVGDAVLGAVEGDGTVLVLAQGNLAARSLAPAIAAELEAEGHRVVVDGADASSYGSHRTLARSRPDTVILVRSSRAVAPLALAQTTTVFAEDRNERRRAEYEQVAAALAAIGPEPVAEDGDALAAAAGIEPRFARSTVLLGVATPARVLYEPALVDLLARGYLAAPELSGPALRSLRRQPLETAWGDDRIDVIELTPGAALYLFGDIRTS